MAIEYYKGHDTYVIYGEETAFGTGTPVITQKFGKINNISLTMNNNTGRYSGLGEGRNATVMTYGTFTVTGSMDFDVDDPTALKYLVGTIQGAGTLANPYEIKEQANIGYDSGNIKTLTIEIGSEGDSNDDVLKVSGVAFGSGTLTAAQGEALKCSLDFVGKTVLASTSLTGSYSAGTTRPFMFHQGTVGIGSDTFKCQSFAVTLNNNLQTYHTLGSRFIAQPVTGLRRYDFTITFKMNYDSTASTLSGTELRDYFFGQANSPLTSGLMTAYEVSLDITEGTGANLRIMNIDMENCYIESWSQPIPLEGGVYEVTINGFGLAAKADATDNVFIRWYTQA